MCSGGKFSPKLACTKLHCPGPAEELRLPAGEGAQGPCPARCQEPSLGNTGALGEPQNTPRALTTALRRAPSAQAHPQERQGGSNISIQLQQRPWWHPGRVTGAQQRDSHTHPHFWGHEAAVPLLRQQPCPRQAAGTPTTGKHLCSYWDCGLEQLQQTARELHKHRLRSRSQLWIQQGDTRTWHSPDPALLEALPCPSCPPFPVSIYLLHQANTELSCFHEHRKAIPNLGGI